MQSSFDSLSFDDEALMQYSSRVSGTMTPSFSASARVANTCFLLFLERELISKGIK
jgi:hypothetical protein